MFRFIVCVCPYVGSDFTFLTVLSKHIVYISFLMQQPGGSKSFNKNTFF